MRKIVIWPADVTIKAFLLYHVRLNLVMRLLRKAREEPAEASRAEIVGRARLLTLLKEQLATGAAKILARSPRYTCPMPRGRETARGTGCRRD